jgi:molybdopterin-guanine dinucleotide biosynthesis protein A
MAEGQDISSLLQDIGLTEYEGRVYVALISLGKARAKEISEITSIAYPKVYDVLASLKQKGFVEEELGRPKIYRPVNPSKAIRDYIEERVSLLKSKAEQLIEVLETTFRKSDGGKSEALVIQSKRGVIVLAGGASKRMGRDKTLLQVKGIPMIKRVVDAALKVSGEVIVVTGNKKMSKQISKIVGGDVVIVEDEKRGWGPLMGMLTGCKRAYAEYVVVVPCDAPFLNPKILMELFKRAEGHDAAIPRWPNGYLEPLHSVYRRRAVLDVAQELMKKDSRSIIRLIESLRDVVYVSVEELKLIDEKLLTFFNVNTPRDLLMAETMESP